MEGSVPAYGRKRNLRKEATLDYLWFARLFVHWEEGRVPPVELVGQMPTM